MPLKKSYRLRQSTKSPKTKKVGNQFLLPKVKVCNSNFLVLDSRVCCDNVTASLVVNDRYKVTGGSRTVNSYRTCEALFGNTSMRMSPVLGYSIRVNQGFLNKSPNVPSISGSEETLALFSIEHVVFFYVIHRASCSIVLLLINRSLNGNVSVVSFHGRLSVVSFDGHLSVVSSDARVSSSRYVLSHNLLVLKQIFRCRSSQLGVLNEMHLYLLHTCVHDLFPTHELFPT